MLCARHMAYDDPADSSDNEQGSTASWYLKGVAASFSIPGLILASAFVGFAGLARGAGLSLEQTLFMLAIVWALPAKVVLIGAIQSGISLPAAAFAVSLSSVRLMPMVVAIVPEMRTRRTRGWVLYCLSHFVAVTSWVLAMHHFSHVPRSRRTTFYAGLGSTLILNNLIVVAIVFTLAGKLPPQISAALLLLTPMYFLTSLWGSAREQAGHAAMLFGLAIGPVCHLLAPRYDLLATGVIAGLLAYGFHRMKAGRRRA